MSLQPSPAGSIAPSHITIRHAVQPQRCLGSTAAARGAPTRGARGGREGVVIVSRSTSAAFNLAVEDWLFAHNAAHELLLLAPPRNDGGRAQAQAEGEGESEGGRRRGVPQTTTTGTGGGEGGGAVNTVYLWRNTPTVVIGKHQNAYRECNIPRMMSDNVFLARRQSGGGAVYQDLGNTNYTFLSPPNPHFKEFNTSIILKALKKFGIHAESSGRNDLTVQGLKVSGAAFRKSISHTFHHGTMLIDVNMNALSNYLTPSKLKLASKGVESVKSRVTNLKTINKEIDHTPLCEAITAEFSSLFPSPQLVSLDESQLHKTPLLRECYQRIIDHKWRYGTNPKYTHLWEHKFSWGEFEIHIETAANKISEIEVFSDCLIPSFVELLKPTLQGKEFNINGIQTAMKEISVLTQGTESSLFVPDLSKWLLHQLTVTTNDRP